MTKSIITLALWLFTATAIMADQLTLQQAEEAAAAFLNKQSKPAAGRQLRLAQREQMTPISGVDEATAYYVFNIGQGKGYVMVSGDDRTEPILGYVPQGAYNPAELPAHIRAWFDGYARQLAFLSEQGESMQQRPRLADEHEAVAPLLTTKWSQGDPYNNWCPIDPTTSERCVTGCVATALAQVLDYFKYPAQTVATLPSYTTSTHRIAMEAIPVTAIDWAHIRDTYSSTATQYEQDAVAQLMLLCGQSVKMDYASYASGADSRIYVQALRNYYGYDNSVRIIDRNDYSAQEWADIIYNEVAAGRPVLYGGLSVGGGHAFVVDGYKSDGLFHVNWGWGGASDGYFALSVLNPYNNSSTGASSSQDGFSYDQDAIIGIQHGTEAVASDVLTVSSVTCQGSTTFTRSSAQDDFSGISVSVTAWNMAGISTTDNVLYLYLLDDAGNAIANLGGVFYGNLGYLYGSSYTFTGISLGAGLTDGDYYIVPLGASGNAELPTLCPGASTLHIKASINGNTLTLTPPTVSMTATITATGKAEVGRSLPLKATISNNGTDFNDAIYLIVDGEQQGGRMFEAAGGTTGDFEIDFTPTSAGSHTISLAYQSDSGFATFATTSVNVSEAPNNLSLNISTTVASVVADSQVSIQVMATNTGSGIYDYPVRVVLYQYHADDGLYHSSLSGSSPSLSLAEGQSTTTQVRFEGLENGAEYLIQTYYVNAGSWVNTDSWKTFSVQIEETSEPTAAEQTIELAQGWNWVSAFLQEPEALATLSPMCERVMGQEAELIRDPQLGMVGSLSFEAGKAYKVQTSSTATGTMSGHLYNLAATPIVLQKGWNWIAFPSAVSATLATAFVNAEEGDILVGQQGYAEFADGNWEGSISYMTPGAGYLYKSASTKELEFTFTAGSRGAIFNSPADTDADADVQEIAAMRRYPATMNITARVVVDQTELDGSRYSITAWAGDELRGKSQCVGKNHYLTVYGEQPVALTLIIDDLETGLSTVVPQTLTFTEGTLGSRLHPFMATISTTTGIVHSTAGVASHAVTTLDGIVVSRNATAADLTRLPKGVYIVDGKKCLVK